MTEREQASEKSCFIQKLDEGRSPKRRRKWLYQGFKCSMAL